MIVKSEGALEKERRIFTIPNCLSFFRLALVPVFIWAYVVRRNDLMTILLLALSGVTDILDGQIARRFDMVSDLGKMLDPVADKVTQGAMLICLLTRFPLMALPLGLLAVKEVFTGITNLIIIRRTGRVEGAALHGKVATVLLDALVLSHLVFGDMPRPLSMALIICTSIAILYSFAAYARRNIAELRKGPVRP